MNEGECLCRMPNAAVHWPAALECRFARNKAKADYPGQDLHLDILRDIARLVVMKELKLNNGAE